MGEGREMGTDRTAPVDTEADSPRLAAAVGAHNHVRRTGALSFLEARAEELHRRG